METETQEKLLKELLRHDLDSLASLISGHEPPLAFSDTKATALLNFAERLSVKPDDQSRLRCLMICGLLWEYRKSSWNAAPAFMVNLLSRLGLEPAMPMVDEDYKASGNRLLPLGSLGIEMAVTARSFLHEVQIGNNKRIELSDFQNRVWESIDSSARLGISAPTSAGKSFVLVHKTIDLLQSNPGTAVFVVPTISLIQQVSRDLKLAASLAGLNSIEVLQSFAPIVQSTTSKVFVLTQERALAALNQPKALLAPRILVVDEIQNIERVANENDERSKILYDVIQEFETTRSPERVVISGPRIENITQLTSNLFNGPTTSITADLPPVVNITYSFAKVAGKTAIKQYTPIFPSPLSKSINPQGFDLQKALGKRTYTLDVQDVISTIVKNLSQDGGTLVFSPTSDQATKTAIQLAENISMECTGKTSELADYSAETIHPEYALNQTLNSGIAFHHGKMPPHVRWAVEKAFSNLHVRALTCTTTLMQGVNLPAKNIIAMNPHLFTRRRANGENASLTAYEFANLRGRAGRLLKDFVGRAIVIDEGSFTEEEVGFGFPSKSVDTGFGSRFEQNRRVVGDFLDSGKPPEKEAPSNDIVVYIRQSIFKHGEEALKRLRRVGINLTDNEYSNTAKTLESIKAPRETILASPYWDPIELNKIYELAIGGVIPELPKTPYASGFQRSIEALVESLRTHTPFYFQKHLGTANEKRVRTLAIYAKKWGSERPLKEIIDWGIEPLDWKIIDKRLADIGSNVMYELPKLLRPVTTMQDKENPVLGFIELGASRPNARRLIELGLPRETAIKIGDKLEAHKQETEINDRKLIGDALKIADQMSVIENEQVIDIFLPELHG